MVLQFFCPVCKEEYNAADELYSTRCGHIFHANCIRNWLNQSSSCPCCVGQTSIHDIFKVYITSRPLESEVDVEENLKYKSELEQSIKNTSECQQKLDESEKNFLQLHLQLDMVSNERLDLLHEKQCLQIIVESLEQELDTKKRENKNLCSLTNNRMPLSGNFANLNINKELTVKDRIIDDLRKQLQDISLELEKEIRNSTMLMVEKIKLQSLVNANKMSRKQQVASKTNNTDSLAAQHTQKEPLAKALASEQSTNPPVTAVTGGAVRKTSVAHGKHQHMDRSVWSLFQYAKRLYKFGFKRVYFENNAVFAKTHEVSEPLQIHSRQQVDDYAKKFTAFTIEVAALTK